MMTVRNVAVNAAAFLLSVGPVAAFVPGFSCLPSYSSTPCAFYQPEPHHTHLYSTAIPELESIGSADEWKSTIDSDGVVKIPSALSPNLAEAFQYSLEDQKVLAWFAGMEGEEAAAGRKFYGQRHNENNCELQLSLLRGGFAGDNAKNVSDTEAHILADVLVDVLGPSGSLTPLFEDLVSSEGELYELAASVTDPGNSVEEGKVQSLLPIQGTSTDTSPLYSIILALQDIDENMAPMSFFVNSHSSGDSQFAACRLATMKRGDAIVFDARILSTPNTNAGETYTMLNIGFRNPKVPNGIGYVGSLRPGYRGALNFGDLKGSLAAYGDGDGDAFKKYGDGIREPFHNVDAVDAVDAVVTVDAVDATDATDAS